MEENGEDLPPFWLQSPTNLRRVDRYRHRLSSVFFNSGILVLFLLVIAVFFMVFIIPSFNTQNFRPNIVKKSWDSVNIVLVLLAIIFGFLSRNRNYDDSNVDEFHRNGSINEVPKSDPSTPNQWYDYSDRTAFNYSSTGMGGLRRNSISYPDLREVSPWVNGDDRWRFSDDTRVYRVSDSDHLRHRRSRSEVDRSDLGTKNNHVDSFVTRPKEVSYTPPPLSPPPQPSPPLPPPPLSVEKKANRTYHKVAHEDKTSKMVNNDLPPIKIPTPPPPSPPPMLQLEQRSRSDRKRGGGNSTKDFLTSLYQKKKKKKQRQKSVDNLEALISQSQPPLQYIHPPPSTPPPPPPPPPSVFQNLFSSKKGRRSRISSAPPPPPPPPPPFMAARGSKSATRIAPVITQKSPIPERVSSFNSVEENSNSGGESPLIRIPPAPPPPPPFKMADWKFVVQGDYVRIQSNNSSRSGSPDLDDVESPLSKKSSESHGGDATSSPLFCPSPDVDTKADSFIARFRAGLKLEKVNSFEQKIGLGMSNLGPKPGPSQI